MKQKKLSKKQIEIARALNNLNVKEAQLLTEIDQEEMKSLSQIEVNPFLSRKKDFFTLLHEKMTHIKEPTIYEQMIKKTQMLANEQRRDVKNYIAIQRLLLEKSGI